MSDGFIIKRGGGGGDSNAAFKALVDKSITEVTTDMLDGVTSIANGVFSSCTSLNSIEIPNSVTSMGSSVFSYCNNLKSITIPSSVTSFNPNGTFSGSYIENVIFEDGTTNIPTSACRNTPRLKNVIFPSTVTSIGDAIFAYCGSSFENLTIRAASPPTLGDNVFPSEVINLVIYVPAESVDAYKAAANWSTYADKIQAIPSD